MSNNRPTKVEDLTPLDVRDAIALYLGWKKNPLGGWNSPVDSSKDQLGHPVPEVEFKFIKEPGVEKPKAKERCITPMLCGKGGTCRRPEVCIYGSFVNGQWTKDLQAAAASLEKEVNGS